MLRPSRRQGRSAGESRPSQGAVVRDLEAGRLLVSVGLELDPEKVLDPSVIERFILCGTAGLTVATRRTLRTNLRFVARRVRGLAPGPVRLARGRAKPPYSQPRSTPISPWRSPSRRFSAHVPGRAHLPRGGAGFIGRDLGGSAAVTSLRSGGLVVSVAGRRPRVVPVFSRYHELLIDSAAFSGERYVTGGEDPLRHNVTTPLISSSLAGCTWHASRPGGCDRAGFGCASQIGLAAFMAAAGISCSQRLGDIVAA